MLITSFKIEKFVINPIVSNIIHKQIAKIKSTKYEDAYA